MTTANTTTPRKHHTGATIFGTLCLGLFAMFMFSQRSAPVETAATKPIPLPWGDYCARFSAAAVLMAKHYPGLDATAVEMNQELRRTANAALVQNDWGLLVYEVYVFHRDEPLSTIARAAVEDCLVKHRHETPPPEQK